MAINFDKALGIHQHALQVRSQRAEVLANNLVNVNTPNFKARDLDFKAMLADKMDAGQDGLAMAATSGSHRQAMQQSAAEGQLQYRTPTQPSIDGNTVEEHVENAEFMKNSLDFQTSFTMLNSKFKGLMTAIRGE